MEHVRAQNWTAIVLDFVIVVVGVFIGIQVSNWNDSLAFEKRERVLLRELHGEVDQNMTDARSRGQAFLIGAESARRVLDAIDRGGVPCVDDCWSLVVDLMHASQWQQVMSSWQTYEELRREGLPRDRRIIEMIEKFKFYSHQTMQALSAQPRYRTLVRGLIPIDAQDAYWDRCFSLQDAVEAYVYPCPPPADPVIDPSEIAGILAHPEIARNLREWTTISRVIGESLIGHQQALGNEILEQIASGEKTSR